MPWAPAKTIDSLLEKEEDVFGSDRTAFGWSHDIFFVVRKGGLDKGLGDIARFAYKSHLSGYGD